MRATPSGGMVAADPRTDPGRWFCDRPLVVDAGARTYVVTKMWGRHTEPTLAALATAFPDAKVTFRRADSPEE